VARSEAPGASATGARAAVTKESIVREALRQIDETGVEAFSIRRVAAALQVTSMAIHWHAGTRQQVLDWVLDEVLAGIDLPDDPSRSWQERTSNALIAVRAHVLLHPNVVDLLIEPTRFTPAIATIGAAMLELFIEEAGLSPRAAVDLLNVVVVFLIGSLAIGKVRLATSPSERDRGRRAARDAIADRHGLDLTDEFEQADDPDADFRRGIEILLASAGK